MNSIFRSTIFLFLCAFSHHCLADDTTGHRGHKCHPEDIRLDLVFVVDSSAGVDKFGFAGEKAAMYGLLNELTISQLPKESKAAFVNMADEETRIVDNLTKYHTHEDAKNALLDMPLLNGVLSVKKGLAKARQLFEFEEPSRKGIPNVIILFSSTSINCDTREPLDQYDACLLANKTQEDGTLLISVALKFHEDRNLREMRLGQYSLSNNETFLDDLENILCTVSPFDPPELVPNACPCILYGLWLDIIIMFDSSDGAGKMNFAAQKAAITGFLHRIFVNQKIGKFSRLAYINLGSTANTIGAASLKQYNYAIEAIGDLLSLGFVGGTIDLNSGFTKAANMFKASDGRDNAKNVLVVFTNTPLKCDHETAACKEAKLLRDDGVIIVTIDVALYGLPQSESSFGSSFGNECFKMSNNLYFLEKFEDYMCKANCFCISPTIQFKDEHSCGIYGQCVYMEDSSAAAESAKVGCGLSAMTLTDVYSDAKDTFLTKIAKDQGADKYIIGLQQVNSELQWSTGDVMGNDDFNLFGPGEPDPRHGNCTYTDLSTGKSVWKTMECSYFQPAMKYFCQKNTCDTGHYCASAR